MRVRPPPPAPPLKGSQTLDMTGFAGFFYCVVSLMYRSLSQPKTGHFRSVFGCFSEGHRRDVQPLQRGVHTHDRIGGCHFRAEIQVRIDVGSRRNIAVSQPLLNFFQADPIGIQKARTAMLEIVIAYLPQSVFLQNIRKALCEIARLDQFPDLVDIDITGVFFAIGTPAQFLIQLLLRFQTVQQFFKRRDKRQTAVTGFRLCAILLDDLALAINGYLRDRMTNGDRLFLEVDSV